MSTPKGFKTMNELRKMDLSTLNAELGDSQKKLFRDAFEIHSGQNKRNDLPKKDRQQIARIKTVIKEKETTKTTNSPQA